MLMNWSGALWTAANPRTGPPRRTSGPALETEVPVRCWAVGGPGGPGRPPDRLSGPPDHGPVGSASKGICGRKHARSRQVPADEVYHRTPTQVKKHCPWPPARLRTAGPPDRRTAGLPDRRSNSDGTLPTAAHSDGARSHACCCAVLGCGCMCAPCHAASLPLRSGHQP